jgi:hypothetical protein
MHIQPARFGIIGLLSILLWGCDVASVELDAPLPKGPEKTAFPASALMTMDEANALMSGYGKAGATVFVPLVFDENDRLHSPESFKTLLENTPAEESNGPGKTGMPGPEVLFTDLSTFQAAVNGPAGKRGSASFADLYKNGRRGSFPAAPTLGKAEASFVEVYDPYSIPLDPCPPEALDCVNDGTGAGDDYHSSREIRGRHDGASIEWPLLRPADVILGTMKDSGSGLFRSFWNRRPQCHCHGWRCDEQF